MYPQYLVYKVNASCAQEKEQKVNIAACSPLHSLLHYKTRASNEEATLHAQGLILLNEINMEMITYL